MPCPDLEKLQRHVSGELDAESSREVDAHATECPSCRYRIDNISENESSLAAVRRALQDEQAAPQTGLPERVGSFRIVRELGRGGMGVVYLAEQERPRREVALKVLRSAAASPEALRRFEHEADLLARLRHPGIVPVYEAGVAEMSGGGAPGRVPYFAMEYVRGERLDEFVRSRGLSVPARLALLANVADAVHHAHLNGLVHRDLKPGNVLVEEREEGAAAPRILDFGVARIADADNPATRRTSAGQILGTIPYMSPEQITGDVTAVDARSDVYALGVLGYEMLAGELPHAFRGKSIVEAAAAVRNEDPVLLGKFSDLLRGDVEAIFAKALEKERERRYQSASEFSADLRRYLADESVIARTPGGLDRIRKFARRNRPLAAAISGIALALMTGAAVSTWQAVRATRAEGLARERLEQAEAARATAELEAAKAEAVNEFLQSILASADPEVRGDRETTVGEAIDLAAQRLEQGDLSDQPEVEGAVRSALGNTYRVLGNYPAAEPHLRRAVEIARSGDDAEELIDALRDLGLFLAQSSDFAAAESALREALRIARSSRGDDHPEVVSLMTSLGGVLTDRGATAEAESTFVQALAAGDGASDPGVRASNLNNLAALLTQRHDNVGAESLLTEALSLARGRDEPDLTVAAACLNNLGRAIQAQGDAGRAEPYYREALALSRELLGEQHPAVATSLCNLASALQSSGRLDEAERLNREALAMDRALLEGDHPNVARSLNDLGRVLEKRGEYDEAEALMREAIAIYRKRLGADHPYVATVLANLAAIYQRRGDHGAAVSALTEAIEIRERHFGADAPRTLSLVGELASIHITQGRFAQAEKLLAPAWEALQTMDDAPQPLREKLAKALDELSEARDDSSGHREAGSSS